MLIVDAHLDLAYNALRGRDVLRPAAEQTPDPEGIPTVGLPDLRAGGVGLVCATVFCAPALGDEPGYTTPQEACDAACAQRAWYQRQEAAGAFQFIRSPADLDGIEDRGSKIEDSGGSSTPSSILHPLSAILLLEGAD